MVASTLSRSSLTHVTFFSTSLIPCKVLVQILPTLEIASYQYQPTLTISCRTKDDEGQEMMFGSSESPRWNILRVAVTSLRRTVIHQYNFVDPVTGIHTQETESAWAHLKYHIKKEKGIRHGEIQDFLDEQMWRDWRGLDATFQNVIILVSNNYPL